jgi:hypothetical protein
MWESLRKKFEAHNDNGLVGLIKDFVKSRLESNKEDLDEWISRIKIMSQGMLALNSKYEKSHQVIIAHIFADLPKMYKSTIKAICNNSKKNMLEEVKKGLTMKWKNNFGKNNKGKSKLDDGIEEALNVEMKKNNFKKKFNRDCHTCQKQGHKAVDCWQKKGKSPRARIRPVKSDNDSTRKCFRCNKIVNSTCCGIQCRGQTRRQTAQASVWKQ